MTYKHFSQDKYALTDIKEMGIQTQKLINFLASRECIDYLESVTGIKNLKVKNQSKQRRQRDSEQEQRNLRSHRNLVKESVKRAESKNPHPRRQ